MCSSVQRHIIFVTFRIKVHSTNMKDEKHANANAIIKHFIRQQNVVTFIFLLRNLKQGKKAVSMDI